MMGWGSDGSWTGWPGPGPILGLVMIFCMLMMARMMGHGHSMSRTGAGERDQVPETPEQRLAYRLAAGEIDIEDYEELRAALQQTENSPGV